MRTEWTGKHSEEHLISQRQPGKTLPYLLSRPDIENSTSSQPLLLFLHGAGEQGRRLSAVKRHGPPKIIETDATFPFITVSPQCPENCWWQEPEMLDLLDELLEVIITQHPVDPQRVYLTGISMGGFGSWGLAAEHPEKFAAVVPICGGGDPKRARQFIDLPIWVFHGENDTIVPLDYSRDMVDAIRQAGGKAVKFTIYPGVGHDSWTATYEDPELYQWLLKQRRLIL